MVQSRNRLALSLCSRDGKESDSIFSKVKRFSVSLDKERVRKRRPFRKEIFLKGFLCFYFIYLFLCKISKRAHDCMKIIDGLRKI